MALCMSAANASAQITTGTITGTVKDAQGGVVPGATVVLISEARGTKSTPAVTRVDGDFVIPNVTADTYTIEVTMEGFKTLRRTGVQVTGGDRVAVPGLVIEVGGATETVNVTAEAALVQSQSGERSFAVTTEQVDNLPINHGNFTSVTSLVPGVVQNGASAGGTRLGGAGQNNIMMDGVSTMDTGNNGQMLQMNVESIAEVKVLTQGYQAEYGRSSGLQITAVTKSGTNRFRGAAYDILTNSDWNENSWVNAQNGDPKVKTKTKTLGLHPRRSGREARRQQQAVLLLHAPVRADDDAQSTAATRSGCGCRRRPSARAISRRRSTTTARLFNLIHDPTSTAACTATNTAGCFQDGGVIGRIPANRLYQAGVNLLNRYPLPNVPQGAGQNYNYQVAPPSVDNLTQQPAIRLDYQMSQKLRFTGKYSGPARPQARHAGHAAGLQRRVEPVPVHHQLRRDGELHADADDLHRRHLRVHPQPARRRRLDWRDRNGRHSDQSLCESPGFVRWHRRAAASLS